MKKIHIPNYFSGKFQYNPVIKRTEPEKNKLHFIECHNCQESFVFVVKHEKTAYVLFKDDYYTAVQVTPTHKEMASLKTF